MAKSDFTTVNYVKIKIKKMLIDLCLRIFQDLPGSVKRIAEFLGKEITDEQTQRLCEHLDIKNFRNNESVNPGWLKATGNAGEEGFIRQGNHLIVALNYNSLV